jgi:hypothetical protein
MALVAASSSGSKSQGTSSLYTGIHRMAQDPWDDMEEVILGDQISYRRLRGISLLASLHS